MKRLLCAVVCCGMLIGVLSGCALFDRTFSSVTIHQEQSASDEDASILRAENYTELVSCVQHFVSVGQKSGTVHVYKYPGDIAEDLEKACAEVREEDPIGAFALNGVSYSYNRIVSYYECIFQFDYRRSMEQIAAVTTVYGDAAIRELLQERMSAFAETLAIRTSSYYADTTALYALAQEAYYASPSAAMGYPYIGITVYPDSGSVRIIEFEFAYDATKVTLDSRMASVTAMAAELVGKESGATETVAWLLYSRLLSMTSYDPDGSDSVYDALCLGSGNSEGISLAYELLCQRAGIPCSILKGTVEGEPRCWNQITLDSTVWYVDLTRADGTERFLHDENELAEMGYQWVVEDDSNLYEETEDDA